MRIYLSVLRVLLILAATYFTGMGAFAFFQHWGMARAMLSVGCILFSIIVLDLVLIQKAFRAKK